jgi:hypothetical protein
MTTITLKALRNLTLGTILLATASACSTPGTQVAALPAAAQQDHWVDSALVTRGTDHSHLLISNRDAGN